MNLKLLILPLLIVASCQISAQAPSEPNISRRPASLNPAIDVIHYKFSIALTDASDMIKGTAEITIKSLQNKKDIYFDLVRKQGEGKGMTVTAVEKNHAPVIFTQDSQHLTINSPLNQGEAASFTIHYEGIPIDGLIISKNMFGHRTFFSDNWPNRAHNWIPCNDHPGDKASVEFTVTAPDHYEVVSNGIKYEEKKLDGGQKLTHWKEDVPLATKIMVIGVADFAINDAGSVGSIPVSSWVFPENKDSGFVHYGIAKNILPWFIKNIGPYPYKKLADVQSKTIFGGMENASAIFYFEESVNSKTLEDLMTHEIAHQWFGNSATEKDWSQVWLSEGFATYMTHAYHETKYGADSLAKRMKKDRASIISFSKTRNTPVVDTSEQKNLMQLLNTNSYQKGGWVLHMLRQQVGDAIFWEAIRTYYSTYAGRNADSEDLRKIFENVSHQNLQPFFKQWLYGPGHPKLGNEWSYDEVRKSLVIKVTQSQDKTFSFPLEIKFTDGNKTRTEKILITDKQTAYSFPVESKPASVIFDPNVNLLFEISR